MGQLIINFFLVFYLLFSASITYAATLYIEPAEIEIHPGDTISLAIRLDTDDKECVNVVDGVLTFPRSVVPVDISLGESILPVWVETPTINTSKNLVTFAGGIPNGYCGRIAGDPQLTNVLFEVILQTTGDLSDTNALQELTNITFNKETQVLLNDGFGSVTTLNTLGSSVLVFKNPGDVTVDEWNNRVAEDRIFPNKFSISLNKVKSVFGNNFFIVFNTTDKQSGIDHYEIIEEPLNDFNLFKWGGTNAPWKIGKSPYRLDDQTLNSTIRVKAVDKAGNEYIATLVPDKAMRSISKHTYLFIGTISVILFILFISLLAFWFYHRKTILCERIELEHESNNDLINDENKNE